MRRISVISDMHFCHAFQIIAVGVLKYEANVGNESGGGKVSGEGGLVMEGRDNALFASPLIVIHQS